MLQRKSEPAEGYRGVNRAIEEKWGYYVISGRPFQLVGGGMDWGLERLKRQTSFARSSTAARLHAQGSGVLLGTGSEISEMRTKAEPRQMKTFPRRS